MQKDRCKWNEKYQRGDYPEAPSKIVKQYARLARGKRALDIATGNGRNALLLADLGFKVDAVDISDAGLKLFAGKNPGIRSICADLDYFDIPAHRYDLIVNIKYLNRRLFPHIREGLTTGGILIFQTFLDSPDSHQGQPSCRDYLLRTNELLHTFLSLEIVFYSEANEEMNKEAVRLASLVGKQIR